MGFEAQYGTPAAPAAMTWEPPFQSQDIDPEKGSVEITNIAGAGHQQRPLPGKALVGGTIASQSDADGMLPLIANALHNASDTTDLGDGAYSTIYGRSQENPVPSITIEKDRDDGVRDIAVGTETTELSITVANGAAMVVSATVASAYSSVWRTATERHPNPASGTLYARGLPPEWIDRPDGSAGDVYFRLLDLFTDAQGREQTVWTARVGAPGAITGTWSVTAGQAAFTGTGGAATTELVPGDVIDVEGERLEVDTVTSANAFTTTGNHSAGASAKRVVREYGEAADAGLTFFQGRPGLSSQTSLPRWFSAKHSSGGFMGNRAQAGSTLEGHLTASTGIVAGTFAQLTGTIAVNPNDATITGTGTAFLAELSVGDYFETEDGQTTRILSIASDTSAEATSKFSDAETGADAFSRPIPQVALTGTITTAGTTALTGTGTLFTTELAAGSWVRTVAGEVNRVLSITNNTAAVMVRAWSGSESGVAGTTDYEWKSARERADWSPAIHVSGLFPELLSELHLFLSTTSVAEEKVEIAESAAITFTAGKAPVGGLGSEHVAGVFASGFSTGQAVLTMRKVSSQLRKAILGKEDVRFRLVCSTGKLISTSALEYTWEIVGHGSPTGKPVGVPDATTNQEILTLSLFANADDTDGFGDAPAVDALQIRVTSDRANPLATS
jgi:hypothetical protein